MDNSKKTVYIHIGWEKTGTSSIQYFLNLNHNNLKKQGFYYPMDNEIFQHNHQKIQISLSDHKNAFWLENKKVLPKDQMIFFIQNIIKNCTTPNLIFSHESFYALDPKLLKKAFANCEVKIIAYIRRPDKWIISAFAQQVSFGNIIGISLKEVVKTFLNRKMFQPLYFSYLQPFIKTFGQNNIVIRVFEKEKLVGQDVILDFLSVLGIDSETNLVRSNQKTNTSLNIDQLAFMIEFGKYAKFQLQKSTVQQIGQLIKKPHNTQSKISIENYINPRIKKRLNKKYQPEVAEISTLFFKGKNIFSDIVDEDYLRYPGLNDKTAYKYIKHIKSNLHKINSDNSIEIENINNCLDEFTRNSFNSLTIDGKTQSIKMQYSIWRKYLIKIFRKE